MDKTRIVHDDFEKNGGRLENHPRPLQLTDIVWRETVMKISIRHAILILFILCFAVCSFATEPKGHLFIIGGGSRPESMMKRFIDLALKFQNGKIIVFPMASGVPAEVGPEQADQLRGYGARSVEYHILSRDQALSPESAELLEGVGGVFFSGGVQSRLADILNGTPVLEKLHEFYLKGGIIGGTSAGAAVMSQIMITGDEKKETREDRAFETIQADNIVTTEGFGFLKSVIVDQHFVRRKRHNRLISLVLENPRITGIGIDESTAILVSKGTRFDVIGQNNVIVYDASQADVDTQSLRPVSGHNLRMHVLKPGDRFDLKSKRVIR
jgi:cyanophycinase